MGTVEFGSEFFAGNRARLRELFSGTAPIVLTANGLLQRSGDTNFPFQQDSNFWYLTGLNEPDLVLVMDKGKEYLIKPDHSSVRDTFDGTINEETLALRSGIKEVFSEGPGWKTLIARLKKVKNIATISALPIYIKSIGLYSNPSRAQLMQRIKEVNPEAELLDLREHLARLRVIKQEPELLAMRQAVNITVDTIKQVRSRIHKEKYHFEYEIEADLSAGFRKRGATGHSFTPIVAGGERACVIHSIVNNAKLGSGELVLLDVGAEVEHYAADLSRTLAPGKKSSSRQKKVHQAVVDVQDYAFSILKPGVIIRQSEKLIEHYMGEKLRELGLIKSITSEAVRIFYPHATSHFVGLDAHDAGSYDLPLEPGMVVTCEPGIYIAREKMGIRIEDEVLINSRGNEVLSRRLPRSLD